MSQLCAIRTETKQFEASVKYLSSSDVSDLLIEENSALVDGIGGITWVSFFKFNHSNISFLEL